MAINRALINGSSRSRIHRNSFNMLTVDLNLAELRRFFQHTVRLFSNNVELIRSASTQCDVIVECFSTMGIGEPFRESCRGEIDNCISLLSSFLSYSDLQEKLPCKVIFEAHSLAGCLNEVLSYHKLASLSFIKALWIAASATSHVSSDQLAITFHRLGRVNFAMGNNSEARNLLRKALAEYRSANVHRNHSIVVDAHELVVLVERRFVETKKKQRQHYSQSASRILSQIQEEDTSDRRMSM